MPRPTVTSILPRTGHTGGDTFVEIKGSAFALPPAKASKGPVTARPPRVRVLFGSTPATSVEVAEAGWLCCKTPEHDPDERRIPFTGDVGTSSLLATAHAIPNGTRVAVRAKPSGSGAPASGVLPAPLDSRRPYFVVGATANALQLALTRGGAPITLTGAGAGALELVLYAAVDVTVQNLGETPARTWFDGAPFPISTGHTFDFLIGEEAQQVTVQPGDVAIPGAATPRELAAILNRFSGIRVLDYANEEIHIETDARGPAAELTIVGGTGAVAIGIDLGDTYTGSADLEPIETEAITIPGAFTFTRPDLGAECHLATTIRALLRGLKREVVANVHMATNTDYDADTGDMVNTTWIPELPALVLTNLRLPENTEEPVVGTREADGADATTFLELKPAEHVDVRFTIVHAAEDPVELLNLVSAVKAYFKRHKELAVGSDRYDLLFLPEEQVSIAIATDNPNASNATGEIVIRQVPVGDMAIADQDELPEGIPAGTRHEGVRDIGWVQDGDTNLDVQSIGTKVDEA